MRFSREKLNGKRSREREFKRERERKREFKREIKREKQTFVPVDKGVENDFGGVVRE